MERAIRPALATNHTGFEESRSRTGETTFRKFMFKKKAMSESGGDFVDEGSGAIEVKMISGKASGKKSKKKDTVFNLDGGDSKISEKTATKAG